MGIQPATRVIKVVDPTIDEDPIIYINNTIFQNEVTVYKDSTFTALDYATAYDKEDGDLTDDIEVTANNVDTSQVGTYSYKCYNKSNNSS
ncbi:MAG: hypothetical protein ATN35_04235 [Epulopiscium sp. Nele67-Bin004]|nr:MAG: hypothetical protein ATN35_04235 [Epulopiscium sp. Nele67-Bin004]